MPKAKQPKKHQNKGAEPGGDKPATSGKSLAASISKQKATSSQKADKKAKL